MELGHISFFQDRYGGFFPNLRKTFLIIRRLIFIFPKFKLVSIFYKVLLDFIGRLS